MRRSFTTVVRPPTAATLSERPLRSRSLPWPTAGCTSRPAPATRTTSWTFTACSHRRPGPRTSPVGLIAQPTSSTQITLAWTDNVHVAKLRRQLLSSRGRRMVRPVGRKSPRSPARTPAISSRAWPPRTPISSGCGPTTASGFRAIATSSSATTPPAGPHSIDYSGGFTTANTTPSSSQGGLAFNGGTQAQLVPGNGRCDSPPASAIRPVRSITPTRGRPEPYRQAGHRRVQHDIHLQHERRRRQPGRRRDVRHSEHRTNRPGRRRRSDLGTQGLSPSFAFCHQRLWRQRPRHRNPAPTASSTNNSPRRTSIRNW